MKLPLAVTRNANPAAKPAADAKLGFGKIFTDHMMRMDYSVEKGWYNARIEPFAPICLSPAAMVFHYGQEVFEGLKAYRQPDGSIALFRPRLNFERMNQSNHRLAIPELDPDFCVGALRQLIDLERDWVPSAPGTTLYVRPFIIATDPFLGVHAAHTYAFMIILAPSGAYYPQGLNPVSIYVEDEYARSVKGGTGYAKTGGNYAASLLSQAKAEQKGFVQVLWLDGREQRYIEEVGSMNVFFVIDGTLVTPQLSGTILPGITRRTVLEVARSLGIKTEERPLSIDELAEAADAGRVSEVFGSGTAAVISPVGELLYGERHFRFNNGEIGPLSQKFYDLITGVQFGQLPDRYNWMVPV